MEKVPEFDYAVLRNDEETGTVIMLNVFWLLAVPVRQGEQTPFTERMWYDYHFLCDHRPESPPIGEGSPQADGVP